MKMAYHKRIITDTDIMMGKPIIAGTRITVELILRQLGQGLSIEKIVENYPHLTSKDIYAAILYAADLAKEEYVYPLPVKQGLKYEKTKVLA